MMTETIPTTLKYLVIRMWDGLVDDVMTFDTQKDANDVFMAIEHKEHCEGSGIWRLLDNNVVSRLDGCW